MNLKQRLPQRDLWLHLDFKVAVAIVVVVTLLGYGMHAAIAAHASSICCFEANGCAHIEGRQNLDLDYIGRVAFEVEAFFASVHFPIGSERNFKHSGFALGTYRSVLFGPRFDQLDR